MNASRLFQHDETENDRCGFSGDLYNEATKILSKYIAIPTINPPGNEKPGAEYLIETLERFGLTAEYYETVPGRGAVICRMEGTDPSLKPVVFVNHIDVVPADELEWDVPPFSGEVIDGYIWGRGALDMKCMAVMQMMAMLAALHRKNTLRRGVVFLALPDEELNGWNGAHIVAERLLDDIRPGVIINEGGYGVENMVFKGIIFLNEVGQKTGMKLRLVARGDAGHGNAPPPDTAVTRLVSVLNRIACKKYPLTLEPAVRETFRTIAKQKKFPESFMLKNAAHPLIKPIINRELVTDKNMSALTRNTISITVMNAGEATNVIPGRAEAVLDVRVLPQFHPDDIVKEIRDMARADDVEVEVVLPAIPSPVTSFDTPLYRLMGDVLCEEVPDAVVAPFLNVGGTDSKHFRPRGIPCYGIVPVVITADDLATIHGKNERISIENLSMGIRVMYRMLLELANAEGY